MAGEILNAAHSTVIRKEMSNFEKISTVKVENTLSIHVYTAYSNR